MIAAHRRSSQALAERWILLTLLLALPLIALAQPSHAAPPPPLRELIAPVGSEAFGWHVAVLPTGTIVVTDPFFDHPDGRTNIGAAYLYDGHTGTLISQLTGSRTGDQVGAGGITVLANGHYLISSPHWSTPTQAQVGAITWGDGMRGITGQVGPTNSLVGAGPFDALGNDPNGVYALRSGHYVITSLSWDAGDATAAGAATWGNGTRGVTGTVGPTNSLVGAAADDRIGSGGITELATGHLVVKSPNWHNELFQAAGAATWVDGTRGLSGTVSAANSLVGSSPQDRVGMRVTALPQGNYVVGSSNWDNDTAVDAGAATWGSGTSGVRGPVSSANSLVGTRANDRVGNRGVTALSTGHYLVQSPNWNRNGLAKAGAVTWGDGTLGIAGVIAPTNSLVGSSADDEIGQYVTLLSNGHYVVAASQWDNDLIANVGAYTWGDGAHGVRGTISAANSLVGTKAGDGNGITRVTPLSNGNYVVHAPRWDHGLRTDVGALIWSDGTRGSRGPISRTNSLIGSRSGDQVGDGLGGALPNGHMAVSSPFWANGAAPAAGAVTWIDGTCGLTGTVSAANSLVGTTAYERLGATIQIVGAHHYVVVHPSWAKGPHLALGAITWADGSRPLTGTISPANSLLGASAQDRIGEQGITVLADGSYVVRSTNWDNGTVANAGAITWGPGSRPLTGTVSPANSLVGSTTDDLDGQMRITTLPSGAYVIRTPTWDQGTAVDAGAVTWGAAGQPLSGTISPLRSLVGSTAHDAVGREGQPIGDTYLSIDRTWDWGSRANVGAITLMGPDRPVSGIITTTISVLGTRAEEGGTLVVTTHPISPLIAVSWPLDNRVTIIMRPSRHRLALPLLAR